MSQVFLFRYNCALFSNQFVFYKLKINSEKINYKWKA